MNTNMKVKVDYVTLRKSIHSSLFSAFLNVRILSNLSDKANFSLTLIRIVDARRPFFIRIDSAATSKRVNPRENKHSQNLRKTSGVNSTQLNPTQLN